MSAIQKWVLYSTFAAIFLSAFWIEVGGLTLFYFYFLILLNLPLLYLMGYLWFPKRLRYFLAYLAMSGVLGLLLGTNLVSGFAKSFLGISLSAIYSASFLRFVRFNAVGAFRKYAQFAFYVAILGFIMLPLPGSTGRLTSLFREPSGFAIVCVPAAYYYADQWQRNRRYGIRLLTVLAACILTFSSVGFIGMMFGIFLFGMRYKVGRVFVPVVVVLVFALAFTQSDMFQLRMRDTLAGLRTNDIENLNVSSFGVVASIFITERQFIEYPVLGGGLGSHVVAHDKFFDSLPGAAFIPDNLRTLGQFDASSLLLRIVSELGIVGLLGAMWYLITYFPRAATMEERSIAIALLCYVFMKFCRSGEYFGAEQFFFLSIYTMIGVKSRMRAGMPATTPASSVSRQLRPAGADVATNPA